MAEQEAPERKLEAAQARWEQMPGNRARSSEFCSVVPLMLKSENRKSTRDSRWSSVRPPGEMKRRSRRSESRVLSKCATPRLSTASRKSESGSV